MKAFRKNTRRNYLKLIVAIFCLFYHIQDANSYSNILRLTAASGSYSDETIVRLKEEATFGFDNDWDALKLNNGGNTPNIYTVLSGMKYVINSIPEDFQETSVPLNLKVAFTGNYTITATDIETYDSSYTIVLEDKLLNTKLNLWEEQQYSFHASTTDSTDRFVIHFQKKSSNKGIISAVNGPSIEEQVKININSGNVLISFSNPQSDDAGVTILNSNGNVFYNEENISTGSAVTIPLDHSGNGNIYIVRVILNNKLICKKIFN